MFPWAVLITGVVGIGGTALGAWLNGRTQTKTMQLSLAAENERARLAEKRRVYVAHQAALNRLFTASQLSGTPTEREYSSLADARTALYTATAEVVLIAPKNMQQTARDILVQMLKFALSVQEDRSTPLPDELNDNRVKLLEAMRADLGEMD
jgi:hypothetical protein